ncbi:MAG: pyridoxamine 5'-phosphate oxidase family protein [Pseudomonadota bacterium]
MITGEVKALIANFPLGFTATVTQEGNAAVAPKGTFLVIDDTRIGFADIRSPGTLKNLAHNAHCEVNFIDILKRKGARLSGTTQITPRGTPDFDALFPLWHATWPDLSSRIRAIVVIVVEAASQFKTPPYDDGASEDEMIALYKKKFAEMYP